MTNNPYVRLVIHAIVTGAIAAISVAAAHPGDTQAIIVAFLGGAGVFSGYGVVSPTYKGVGVGAKPTPTLTRGGK